MANRVNAAATDHADVVKEEPRKDMDDAVEIDSRKPIVSPKQNTDGNGDVKPAKPGKDVMGAAGKGGSGSKLPDNEVFIPAPPPATNAWTKRMQVSCSAVKSPAESADVDDKHSTARSPSESNKSTPAVKQSPNRTPTDHSAKGEPHSSRLRLEESSQTKSMPASGASSSKQPSVENAENLPSSSKHAADVRPKHAGEESSKAEVHVKSASSVSDTAPGGCWKKPATAAHVQSVCEASVAQGSPATKQHCADSSAGELLVSVHCFVMSYYFDAGNNYWPY